eukprot:1886229-Rhodomonas_salina.4
MDDALSFVGAILLFMDVMLLFKGGVLLFISVMLLFMDAVLLFFVMLGTDLANGASRECGIWT